MSGGKGHNQLAMSPHCHLPRSQAQWDRHWARARMHPSPVRSHSRIPEVHRVQFHVERRRHGLIGGELADPSARRRASKDRYAFHSGRNLLQQFQPFSANAVFIQQEADGIAARACQAGEMTRADWINCKHEHNWQDASSLLEHYQRLIGRGQNDVRRGSH